LVGIFRPVIEIAMLAMFHTHEDFPLRRQPIREALEALLTEHPIERRLRKGQGHSIACLPPANHLKNMGLPEGAYHTGGRS
jgi:hypothetical protein